MSIDDTDELALVLPEDLLDDIIVNLCSSCIGSYTKGATEGGGTSSGLHKVVYILIAMLQPVMLYD